MRRISTPASCPYLPGGLLAPAAVLLLAMLFALTACGGNGDDDHYLVVDDRPSPPVSELPSTEGRSLGEMSDLADPGRPEDPVVTPGAEVFYSDDTGGSRYPVYVTDRDGEDLTEATVTLYAAPIPRDRREAGSAFDQPARGPFPADLVSLAVDPEYRSEPPHPDHEFASSFFLARIPFDEPGEWRLTALVENEGRLTAHTLASTLVDRYKGIPQAGQPAPVISTPTADDAAGDRAKLSTRNPPSTQNDVDFEEVLGKMPVALLFASPEFCQSRVCGPVVDIAEQVKESHGDRVEFIQMEIYNENDPSLGVRPQVRAYNLPSEPWLFVIDEDGMVSTAVEGAFGANEMTEAVMEVMD